MKNLHDYRKSYEKSELTEVGIPNDPLVLFRKWFQEAEDSKSVDEVNAMTIATIGPDGFPKSRVVLLKEIAEDGFLFFTNYHSEKGKSIAANPNVCLLFFWPALERQVIIKGKAQKTSESVSDVYFQSRPEGSKLGAIVSNQSDRIDSREQLEDAVQQLQNELNGKEIVRPKHWGGYFVEPISIEFWQGRANRLHDRIVYKLENSDWHISRLAP